MLDEKLDEPNKNISYTPLTADSLNEQTLFYTIPVRVTNRSLKNSPYFFLNRRKLDIATYHCPRVLTSIQMNKPGPSVPKQIPRCAVLNARFLAKPEACRTLYPDLKSNNIDVCCISETWVKYAVPNHLIFPSGFYILRKDRTNRLGGGVAIICRNDWKMQEMSDFDNPFKCLWTEITTHN